jgi:hypothetical protein
MMAFGLALTMSCYFLLTRERDLSIPLRSGRTGFVKPQNDAIGDYGQGFRDKAANRFVERGVLN